MKILNKIIKPIENKESLSNKVYFGEYKNESVVLKIYDKSNFKYTNILNEEKVLSQITYQFNHPEIIEYVEKKYLITKDLKSKTFNSLDFHTNDILNIANVLKGFHTLDKKNISHFDPIGKINLYMAGVEKINDYGIIKKVEKYLENFNNYKVCHNDLVRGNFILKEKEIYLIDFEFSGLNDIYFDIASFFTECNILEIYFKPFLDEYFGYEKYDIKILNMWIKFHNVLWYYWAMKKYQDTHNKIYWKIANEKKKKII